MSGLAAARAAIVQHIGWLDALIGAQLDAVLHHPRFQDLEARWRGLAYLAGHAHRHQAVVLRLLALTKDELAKDIGGVLEIDASRCGAFCKPEIIGLPALLPDPRSRPRAAGAHLALGVEFAGALGEIISCRFARPPIDTCAFAAGLGRCTVGGAYLAGGIICLERVEYLRLVAPSSAGELGDCGTAGFTG